jgi:putative transposase
MKILKEEITPLRVNEIWHADITYIRLRASFVYLAALVDGC